MALAPVLSGVALALAAAFGGLVLARWRRGRRRHQLLWGLSLLLFAAASAMEVQGFTAGWGAALYRAYFVLTAVMVGLMAAGTGHLVSRRLGDSFAAYTVVLAQALLLIALLTPADAARLAEASGRGEVPTRVLAGAGPLHALVDVPAAALLVGAPLVGWRRTRAAHTLLIAAGAAVFTGVHTLASGAQTGVLSLSGADLFTAGSLAGLVLLFAGYARSRDAPARGATPQAVAALG